MDPMHLYESRSSSGDFIVTIGNERFPAHAFVLKNSSKYFADVSATSTEESTSHELLCEKDAARWFEAVLQFMYTKEFKPPDRCTVDAWREIFRLADYLGVPGFVDHMHNKSESPFAKMKDSIEQQAKLDGRDQTSYSIWLIEQCKIVAPDVSCDPLKDALLDLVQAGCSSAGNPVSACCITKFFREHFAWAKSECGTSAVTMPRSVSQKDVDLIVEFAKVLATQRPSADESTMERDVRDMKRRKLHEEAEVWKKRCEQLEKQLSEAKGVWQKVASLFEVPESK